MVSLIVKDMDATAIDRMTTCTIHSLLTSAPGAAMRHRPQHIAFYPDVKTLHHCGILQKIYSILDVLQDKTSDQ